MFFFFFDPLKSDLAINSDILKKCYLDIFFEKLYRDKYINIKQVTDSMTKSRLRENYSDLTYENSKRKYISTMLRKLLNAKKEELPRLLFSLDNDFEKNEITFEDLNDDDKRALILTHLLYVNKEKNQESKASYVLSVLQHEDNHTILVHDYRMKQMKKHGYDIRNLQDQAIYSSLDEIKYDNGYLYYSKYIQIQECPTIREIENVLSHLKLNDSNKLFFRGHSDINYQLIPSIYRTEKGYSNENIFCEESLIRNPEEYQLCGNEHLNILKKMQHYGLPTRLLDISDSLLVALYFAVETNFESDGELIVFNTDSIKYTRSDSISVLCSLAFFSLADKEEIIAAANDKTNNVEDFNNVKEVKRLKHEVCLEKPAFLQEIQQDTFKSDYVVVSKRDNRRISQQSGAFIVPSLNIHHKNSVDDFRILNADGKKIVLKIPKKNKIKILKELELFGITKSFIYPEIEEVAKFLKVKYY